MEITNTLEVNSQKEWRAWLRKNCQKESEIWLVYYKKHTGKVSINYMESLAEAICFGWIDGLVKRMDEEKYTRRFTPRRKNSKWSPTNIRIAQQMIREKKMSKFGLSIFNQGKEYEK